MLQISNSITSIAFFPKSEIICSLFWKRAFSLLRRQKLWLNDHQTTRREQNWSELGIYIFISDSLSWGAKFLRYIAKFIKLRRWQQSILTTTALPAFQRRRKNAKKWIPELAPYWRFFPILGYVCLCDKFKHSFLSNDRTVGRNAVGSKFIT